MELQLDQPIADFIFTTTAHEKLSFSELKGKNIVLYFYPKDNTPGCTQESIDFRDAHAEFTKLKTVVLGISRDSLKSHHNFKEKYCLPFALITDSAEELCSYFNVVKMKNMYGKKVRGIERSTFLIDKNGILRHEWRGVKVPEHIVDILNKLKQLK
jgi:peroxiredoxin Q/BCP